MVNRIKHAANETGDVVQKTDTVSKTKVYDWSTFNSSILSACSILASLFIVFGGAIPYFFQYVKIRRQKSAAGFSLYICMVLSTANILRVMFWFGKKFEQELLIQSFVMITTMVLMLEISVRMNRRRVARTKYRSIWTGDLFHAFWKWNDTSSFVAVLLVFTLISGVVTYFFQHSSIYVESLGMVALAMEASLGIPQLVQNFKRKSTKGMSTIMIIMWLLGDAGKTVYFFMKKTPVQFWICSCTQIAIDVLILAQACFYDHEEKKKEPFHYSI